MGENSVEKAAPDCGLCYYRDTCENAEEGCFCPKFMTKEPVDRGIGPAERWSRGDEDPGL